MWDSPQEPKPQEVAQSPPMPTCRGPTGGRSASAHQELAKAEAQLGVTRQLAYQELATPTHALRVQQPEVG